MCSVCVCVCVYVCVHAYVPTYMHACVHMYVCLALPLRVIFVSMARGVNVWRLYYAHRVIKVFVFCVYCCIVKN